MTADLDEHAPQRAATRREAPRPRARCVPATLGWLVAAATTGCTQTLDLATLRDPTAPTAIIPYAGVRTGERRHADYGGIDRRILEERR